MKKIIPALFVSVLCLLSHPVGAEQQEVANIAAAESSAAKEIAGRLHQLTQDIASIQMLATQLDGAPSVDRESLSYWRDTRSLETLAAVDKIAILVAELPKSDPRRLDLESRMLEDFRWLGRSVYTRIDELDKKIVTATTKLESKQGPDLVLADSVIYKMESTRDLFLRAMVDHIETRESLGLSTEHTMPPLKLRLILQAESVAGRLVFVSALLKDLGQRLAQDKENSDLLVVHKQAAEWHEHNLDRLRDLLSLMERVDIPVAAYRSLIVKESGGISVDMIRPDVFLELITGRSAEVKDFALKRGPDIVLNVLVFLGILLLFRLLSKLSRRSIERALGRSKWDISQLLKETLAGMSGFVVMIIGLLIALAQVGISLGPMLAGLGLAGFIVGIALQDTLANFASGAMILIYRPYDVDDYIEAAGAAGLVKKMTLVSTTINTFDNQTLIVPNRNIWGNVIKNVTAQRVRRVDLKFGIGHTENIEKAERILAEAAEAHQLVLSSPDTLIKVDSLGDSSVNLVLRPWVKTEDYWTVHWDLTRDVKLRFDAAGISIAFPQRDIHIHYHDPAKNQAPSDNGL